MHGNPFTHATWHKVAPRLAQDFTVVCTDLRGYGESEKPPGGPDHAGYSFRAMAKDQIEVMAALGFDRFMAAGDDRGARVLHRMTLDHPDKVAKAAIMDIIPQHHLFNHVTQRWATGSYHWFFMIQPFDLPERLMGADPDYYIARKLSKTEQGLSFFGKEALADYMRCFRNPATIHAMCEDYRATAGVDLAMDTMDFEAGRGRDAAAAAVGRNRRRRTPEQAGGRCGRTTPPTCAAPGAALRALPVRGGARGNLWRAARVFHGAIVRPFPKLFRAVHGRRRSAAVS